MLHILLLTDMRDLQEPRLMVAKGLRVVELDGKERGDVG
jgi:hypothetical protein